MKILLETFRRKFMEGVAGIADRMAGACAGLVASPGGMAPHDMEPELARLVGRVPDGLSAAAVTAAAAQAPTAWRKRTRRPRKIYRSRRRR